MTGSQYKYVFSDKHGSFNKYVYCNVSADKHVSSDKYMLSDVWQELRWNCFGNWDDHQGRVGFQGANALE